MARYLFIAQTTLDTWMDQDKIAFDGDVMTIKADQRKFKLIEAVRFVKVEGGDVDTNGLIGKVKTNGQLDELGAERYMDSVIYNDVAYKVQEGFIGEVFISTPEKVITLNVPKKSTPSSNATKHENNGEVDVPSANIQVARTQPKMQKVSNTPPSLSKSASVPARGVVPQKTVSNKQGEKKKDDTEGMSDEELLTRFLLDNL